MDFLRMFFRCFLVWLVPGAFLRSETPVDFNRDIRPILSENCFYCHGQDGNHRKADLRLDIREAALKEEAFVPGKADQSELIIRVFSDDPDEMMPPPDSNRSLGPNQKSLLREWIAAGAKYEKHWSFIPPQRPEAPAVETKDWPRNPIDQFVLAKLESLGLKPSPEADRPELMKRLHIDLTGLPPTPEEVAAFVNDPAPDAYEKVVDHLLASPHYGERMAISWLDAARYADSNGFQQDGDTWQWIWRDWVVKALNEDMPFDQFTTWQLAGDLLPGATTEQKIASGFNRNHLLNGEGGNIAEEQRFVVLFDRVDTTATTWLGLTMACAQCHDHKYDPITQQDYYRFLDAFNQVDESGTPQRQSARIRVAKPFLELPTEENREKIAEFEREIAVQEKIAQPLLETGFQKWRKEEVSPNTEDLAAELVTILKKAEADRLPEEEKKLEGGLRKHFNAKIRDGVAAKIPEVKKLDDLKKQLADYKGDQIPRPMIMSDAQHRETNILDRGAYLNKLEKVSFETPAFLPPAPEDSPKNRLGLAQWLTDPGHPLTARVQTNRMWQHFFGIGLVKTSEDFGVQSEYPVHRELLDWLACEFMERGWSPKAMHRLIVTSATYRQSSRMSPWQRANDPQNRLLSRASRFRMPSMILRDWALATSGLIDLRIGGQPVYPYQPETPWETLAQVTKERDFTYPASTGRDLYRRSLYTFWRRTISPANMFDASTRQACRVSQSTNNTPLDALTTLNDPTWIEAARQLAGNALVKTRDIDASISEVYLRINAHPPSDEIRRLLRDAYDKQFAIYEKSPGEAEKLLSEGESKRDTSLSPIEHAALTATSLAILNLDESLTRQ